MQCAHLTVSQNCQTVLADCQNCLAKQFLPKLWQKLTWSQNNFWYPTPTLNCLNAIFWRLAMNLGNEPDIVQYLLCMIEFVSNEVFFFNPEKFWRGYFLILLWLLSCLLSTIPAIEKSFYPVPWILAWRKCSSCKVGSFIMSEKGKKMGKRHQNPSIGGLLSTFYTFKCYTKAGVPCVCICLGQRHNWAPVQILWRCSVSGGAFFGIIHQAAESLVTGAAISIRYIIAKYLGVKRLVPSVCCKGKQSEKNLKLEHGMFVKGNFWAFASFQDRSDRKAKPIAAIIFINCAVLPWCFAVRFATFSTTISTNGCVFWLVKRQILCEPQMSLLDSHNQQLITLRRTIQLISIEKQLIDKYVNWISKEKLICLWMWSQLTRIAVCCQKNIYCWLFGPPHSRQSHRHPRKSCAKNNHLTLYVRCWRESKVICTLSCGCITIPFC